MRGFQQSVDDTFIGIRGLVLQEGIDIFGSGRKANQVETESPNQRVSVGFDAWLQPGTGEAFTNKCVDRVARRQ